MNATHPQKLHYSHTFIWQILIEYLQCGQCLPRYNSPFKFFYLKSALHSQGRSLSSEAPPRGALAVTVTYSIILPDWQLLGAARHHMTADPMGLESGFWYDVMSFEIL